ncbi:M48 family metalloprotease [Streptomyces sp. NPDC059896]|uniref:M48 family metalloprotease n=1 Tax=Streptomyces sp. NPDC059896 TaxID=3346993 RepID=UPI003659FE80
MTFVLLLVVLALGFPWGAARVARRLAGVLPPRAACWTLTGGSVLLAGGTVAALIGLFHVPFLASLERIPLHRVLEVWPAAVPVACAAGAVMAVQGVLLVRRWLQHRSLLERAWLAAAEGTGDGDLLVVPGGEVDAFALPGYRGRRGRVVMTSGMARTVKDGEREVLLAHERAHLDGRHHVMGDEGSRRTVPGSPRGGDERLQHGGCPPQLAELMGFESRRPCGGVPVRTAAHRQHGDPEHRGRRVPLGLDSVCAGQGGSRFHGGVEGEVLLEPAVQKVLRHARPHRGGLWPEAPCGGLHEAGHPREAVVARVRQPAQRRRRRLARPRRPRPAS